MGVPVIIGKDGVKKIVEVKPNDVEEAKFAENIAIVCEVSKVLTGVL